MTYRVFLAAVVALFLLPTAARAQINYVGDYQGAGGKFLVATFRHDEGGRVGIVGIEVIGTGTRVSVAVNKPEWNALLALWQKAKAVQSKTWQLVGSFKETETEEESLLTVMAGPGVQFTIADSKKGTFTVSLGKNNTANIEASLRRVTQFLAQ